MKLCKNCKYHVTEKHEVSLFLDITRDLCKRKEAVIAPPCYITGEYDVSALGSCYCCRSETGPCGNDGKLYEPNTIRKLLIKLKVVTE